MSNVPYLQEIDDRFNVLEAIAIGGSLANGKIIVGNGSGVAAPVTPSGDATMTNAGVIAISSGVIVNADVNAAAAIAHSKLAATTAGYLLMGTTTSGVVTGTAMSQDATITGAGVVTVAKINNKTISHVPMFGGLSASENDADASVVVSTSGIAATDIAIATVSAAANPVYVLKAVCTTDTLTITLSGNGGAGTVVNYVIFRAA